MRLNTSLASRVALVLGALTAAACSEAVPTDTGSAPEVALSVETAARIVVDQQNASNPAPLTTIAIGGGSNQILLQSFTTGRGGRLRAIAVPVGCSPGAMLTLDMFRASDDGLPIGTVFASSTLPASRFPSTVGAGTPFTAIPIREPLLSARRRYAFVLSASGSSCAIVPALVGDTYLRGDFFFDARPNSSGWVPNRIFGPTVPWDLPFQTMMMPS
jgi:hypothetical protein